MALLLDLLLPPACAACGRVGAVLCDRCIASMTPPDPGSFVVPDGGIVVGGSLLLAVGALTYRGATRRALGRLKYAGTARVAAPLAAVAAPAVDRLLAVSGPAVMVPVPVHPTRERQRGYNQARLIADALAHPRGLRVMELLERRQATERQHRLDRAARLRNLRDAISVRKGVTVPATIVVVDDILTTSATLEACATVLLAAGARAVYGLAIAREV
jgi:ComF family protein